MTDLIIAEKPSAALKIATSLADSKVEKHLYKKVAYYEISHSNKKLIVACAVGHLYNLAEKEKKGWTYPVFDIEWKPSYDTNKTSGYTRPYLELIQKLSKDVKEIYNACDFDVEGETIFKNILNFSCKKKDAKRMKFSTTTKEDLTNAYEHPLPHIDLKLAEAGETRHFLDHYWGINLSRALTLSVKSATGMFKILSSGRVQGPALKMLAEREIQIKNFKPVPFWQIELLAKELNAWHEEDKIFEKPKAEGIAKNASGKKAYVSSVEKERFKQEPPHPFDLTALQLEAYRQFGISPKETLATCQDLYINSYISYPRTSSNQLPESIGYKKIIEKLSHQSEYAQLCKKLLKQASLKPNNGKKTDPAHPAIYATGEVPKGLESSGKKIYDLIVRRILSTFAEPAERESVFVEIDVNGEKFNAKGATTVYKGWHEFYGPYAKFEEIELPKLENGQELHVNEIKLHEKETAPPKRYTPASVIKALETRGLGTKATRAEIVDTLFQRNYVKGTSIEVTDLGLKTVETLKKYCHEILDDKLTKDFEEDMEEIREGKNNEEKILANARAFLTKSLEKFKANEKNIGEELSVATKETMDKENHVGKCDKCGGELSIRYSKRFNSRFVACKSYPDCKNTFSLPFGLPKVTDKLCPECNYPLVLIIRAGKRPFDYCINKQCPKKLEWVKQQQELKAKNEAAKNTETLSTVPSSVTRKAKKPEGKVLKETKPSKKTTKRKKS